MVNTQHAQNNPFFGAITAPVRNLSLRPKIYGLAIVGTLIGVAVLFYFSRAILMNNYRKLETEAIQQNVQRVLNALDEQLTSLERTSADWAYRDDTYQFIQSHYPAFIQSNLSADALQQLHLNVIMMLDTSGRVVLQKAEDLTKGTDMPLPEGLTDALQPGSVLLRHDNLTAPVSGLVMLKNGAMLATSRAILQTDGAGPSRGTLVIGRLLDQSEIDMLAERTQVAVTTRILGVDSLTDDFLEASKRIPASASPILVLPLSGDLIAGYAVSRDLFDRPLVLWRAEMPREITATGRASIQYFTIALAAIGVAFMILLLVLIERFVLSPIGYLHRTVQQIGGSDPTMAIALPNQDELGDLASAINQMVTELHDTQNSLRQTLQFKSDVLANVSHEARSPLSTIKLRTEMLTFGVNGPLTPPQQQSVELIQNSADQLLFFVNNLLDASRLEAKSITLTRQPFEPAALVESVVMSMKPQADNKGLTLSESLDGSVPPVLLGDPDRVRQIVANLVDNGIKFTERGSVRVTLSKSRDGQICIEVVDTGIGIPPADQAHIFEAFYQADGSMTRRQMQGVGLGLSIVKQLIDLMDGTISVQSTVNVGTTMTVYLPLSTAGEPSL